MKYGISIREYKGLYFVEFQSRSLGCTLLATWDKDQAQAEYNKFSSMNEQSMIHYLNNKEV